MFKDLRNVTEILMVIEMGRSNTLTILILAIHEQEISSILLSSISFNSDLLFSLNKFMT